MKLNKKNKLIIIIAAFVIIIIGIIIISINFFLPLGNNNYLYEANYDNRYDETGAIKPLEYIEDGEQFVSNLKADELKEEKEISNYIISNFKMIKGNDRDKILMEIKNNSQEEQKEKEIIIKLLDNRNNEIETVSIVIPELAPNSSIALTGFINCEAEQIFDYNINILDFEIKK